MKHLLAALLTLLLLAACGEERQTFLLEGTFKGFNQGELYIYGAEGNREMDTIAVVKGRFHYEIPLEDSTTFVLVFPNFTELPVFGTKGAEITIEADASHLREAEVTGNRENEEFTKFRKNNIDQAPPEFALSVANFIKDNPASPFATYLLRRYFVQTPEPNYPRAIELAQAILKNHRDTTGLDKFLRRFEGLRYLRDGGRLPAFTVTDVLGRPVKSSDLDAKCNVISVWSSENYESPEAPQHLPRCRCAQYPSQGVERHPDGHHRLRRQDVGDPPARTHGPQPCPRQHRHRQPGQDHRPLPQPLRAHAEDRKHTREERVERRATQEKH